MIRLTYMLLIPVVLILFPAKSFIKALLNPDPANRPTAEQALLLTVTVSPHCRRQ